MTEHPKIPAPDRAGILFVYREICIKKMLDKEILAKLHRNLCCILVNPIKIYLLLEN